LRKKEKKTFDLSPFLYVLATIFASGNCRSKYACHPHLQIAASRLGCAAQGLKTFMLWRLTACLSCRLSDSQAHKKTGSQCCSQPSEISGCTRNTRVLIALSSGYHAQFTTASFREHIGQRRKRRLELKLLFSVAAQPQSELVASKTGAATYPSADKL